jgi:hypothetical protein
MGIAREGHHQDPLPNSWMRLSRPLALLWKREGWPQASQDLHFLPHARAPRSEAHERMGARGAQGGHGPLLGQLRPAQDETREEGIATGSYPLKGLRAE